jgi:hypothetical protein
MSETDISRDIHDALCLLGHPTVRINSGRVKVRGAWMHLAPAGTPDRYVEGLGGFWLETKTPIGKLSEKQRERHQELASRGERVAVVSSVEEAVRVVLAAKADRRRG